MRERDKEGERESGGERQGGRGRETGRERERQGGRDLQRRIVAEPARMVEVATDYYRAFFSDREVDAGFGGSVE